ncbi:MAG: hypothetical protein FWG71_09625, partial [Synergistaceae bacterium]|nr:hypothetical protein [Synergistaceae bacterium]
SYANGANIGFFPLPVMILPSPGAVSDHGLFFNVADGSFYKNESLIPEAQYVEVNEMKGTAWDWDSSAKTLSLTDFVWHADAAKNVSVALTIVNGTSNDADDLIVKLNGVNIFGVITNEAMVAGDSYAIYAEKVSLSITGDGKLSAVAGKTTNNGKSIGIYAPSLTMEEGILYATGNGPAGGDSIGLVAASLTVNGGMLYATGGGRDGAAAGNSIGINTPSLKVSGGVLESVGYDNALNNASITLPESYTYWTNDEPEPPAKIITSQLLAGTGTLYYDGPGSGEPYVWEQSQKYVKITRERFAVIENNVTIDGELDGQRMTIRLYGDTVHAALKDADASSWFIGLPSGVKVVANSAEDSDVIVITFEGKPSGGGGGSGNGSGGRIVPIDITIPGNELVEDEDLPVRPNPNAKFEVSSGGGDSCCGCDTGIGTMGMLVLLSSLAFLKRRGKRI